jgi:hypothetical protein
VSSAVAAARSLDCGAVDANYVGVTEFVVIDLLAQKEAVRAHVSGWPLDAVVSWLSQFGTVEEVAFRQAGDYPPTFRFSSKSGPAAAFAQQPDGSLSIFSLDH